MHWVTRVKPPTGLRIRLPSMKTFQLSSHSPLSDSLVIFRVQAVVLYLAVLYYLYHLSYGRFRSGNPIYLWSNIPYIVFIIRVVIFHVNSMWNNFLRKMVRFGIFILPTTVSQLRNMDFMNSRICLVVNE